MEDILKYMMEHGPVYFATCEDNRPTIRPYGFCTIFEGKPTFVASPVGRLSKQVKDNPFVEASCSSVADTNFLRIHASVRLIEDPAEVEKLVKENPHLEVFGGHMFPFSLVDGEAVITNFRTGEAEKTVKF